MWEDAELEDLSRVKTPCELLRYSCSIWRRKSETRAVDHFENTHRKLTVVMSPAEPV